MDVQLTSRLPETQESDWLILPFRPDHLPVAAAMLASRLRERGDLDDSLGAVTVAPDCDDVKADRIAFVSFGRETLDTRELRKPIATALRKVLDKARRSVAFVLPDGVEQVDAITEIVRAALVTGVGQAVYQADATRQPPASLTIVGPGVDALPGAEQAVERGRILGESVNVTRDLVNRHAGEIFPESFAERASSLAEEAGLSCDVYDESWLLAERFGSMLAVAQGSVKKPRLVVLKHNGGGEEGEWFGLCGKGVTFDSGGLSMKPSAGMIDMKADMGGGATVLGAMLAIARLNLPVNVIASIGLVENMVSGNSYRLGDVLTARNGTTIEVHNTDAEGRLVLADVLAWTVEQGAERVIDLATLTGACVIALGEDITGLFPNDDEWASEILDAAETEGEDVWQLPMHDAFNEQLKSDVADCKNVGTRWGGATTAAKFLEKFVGDATWAHLDIAGPAFASSSRGDRDGGATGAMVNTLVRLFENITSHSTPS